MGTPVFDQDKIFTAEAGHLLNRSPLSVRDYERRGLLHPLRTANGTRIFSKKEVLALAKELRKQEPPPPPWPLHGDTP